MAQNVIINGVTYSNVPSVNIPLDAGGGNATFFDTSTSIGVCLPNSSSPNFTTPKMPIATTAATATEKGQKGKLYANIQ